MGSDTKGSFWTSTAAMIAAIGTLLAGLVAVATFAVSRNWFGVDDPPESPPPTGSNGSPLPKLDEAVQWGPEPLLLNSSIDFDTDPPNRGVAVDGSDTYIWSDIEMSSSHGMAKWDSSVAPTQNGCSARLATFGTSDNHAFEQGDKFCIMTDRRRIVLLVVDKKTENGWQMRVTVWKQRLPG